MASLDTYCGIYCGACLCTIAKEAASLEEFSQKVNRPVEMLSCPDCKTAKYQECCFVTCCTSKGINNCSECDDMPCSELTKFATDGHVMHASTIPNLLRIREIGLSAWLQEQRKTFSCPSCGAKTGWNYKQCDHCLTEIELEK
jgi:hypothetical protein